MKNKKKILYWIAGLALFGVLVSLYTYLYKLGAVSGDFCTINSTFDCASVNASQYSEIYGVPVSVLGILGYGFMAVAAFMKSRNLEDKGISMFLVLAALGGLGFSVYLSGIEAFVLHAWCILCLISQATMLAIAILVAILFRSERKSINKL